MTIYIYMFNGLHCLKVDVVALCRPTRMWMVRIQPTRSVRINLRCQQVDDLLEDLLRIGLASETHRKSARREAFANSKDGVKWILKHIKPFEVPFSRCISPFQEPGLDLLDLVRGAEAIESMDERHPAPQRGNVRREGEV